MRSRKNEGAGSTAMTSASDAHFSNKSVERAAARRQPRRPPRADEEIEAVVRERIEIATKGCVCPLAELEARALEAGRIEVQNCHVARRSRAAKRKVSDVAGPTPIWSTRKAKPGCSGRSSSVEPFAKHASRRDDRRRTQLVSLHGGFRRRRQLCAFAAEVVQRRPDARRKQQLGRAFRMLGGKGGEDVPSPRQRLLAQPNEGPERSSEAALLQSGEHGLQPPTPAERQPSLATRASTSRSPSFANRRAR